MYKIKGSNERQTKCCYERQRTSENTHTDATNKQTNKQCKEKRSKGNGHWISYLHVAFRYFINVTKPAVAKTAVPKATYGHQF